MYRSILVPLDGSALAECVLPHVCYVASGFGVESVTFLRVVAPIISQPRNARTQLEWQVLERLNAENKAAAEKYLADVVKELQLGPVAVRAVVVMGNAAEEITEYARREHVDLIVMATHGRSGVRRLVWGSAADRVLRSSVVPILLVRATPARRTRGPW